LDLGRIGARRGKTHRARKSAGEEGQKNSSLFASGVKNNGAGRARVEG